LERANIPHFRANAGKHNFTVCRERRRFAGTPPKAACLAKTIANIGDAEHFCA
jgi:hypothetical protein